MIIEISGVKAPSDETVIWRYTDFPKFISLLSTSRLYFPRTDVMEDKWEGWYPLFHKGSIPDEALGAAKNEFWDNVKGAQGNIRKMMFINCWHINEHGESVAMWKIYTLMGQGIAVRTTVGRLKAALQKTTEDIVVAEVTYGSFTDSQLYDGNNVFPIFTIKSHEYSYEREVRAMLMTSGQPLDQPTGKSIEIDRMELIERVILAPRSEPYLLDAVQSLLINYGMGHIKVEKSDLDHLPPILRT